MALPNQQAFHTGYQPNFGFYDPLFSQHSGQNLMLQPSNPTGGMQSFSPEPNFSTNFQTPTPSNNFFPPPPSSAPSSLVEWSPFPTLPPRQSRYQLPNPERTADNSLANRAGTGGNTTSSARSQGRERRGATRSGNIRNPEATPIPERGTEQEEEETAGKSRIKGRNRAMNAQEKLVLIRECCENADEYKNGNKTAF